MPSDTPPLLWDGFEPAFMGVLRRFGQKNAVAVYDYNRCMDILIKRDNMEEDEAVEWIEHNCLGGWLGEGTPAMVFRCSMLELCEEYNSNNDRDYGDEHPEDKNDSMTKEEKEMFDEAIRDFAFNFMKYVREVDSSIYTRAKQYAIDFSGNEVVEFIEDKKGNTNENCD
jgi:hypothetical protein